MRALLYERAATSMLCATTRTRTLCARAFTSASASAPAPAAPTHNFSFSGAGFLTSYHFGVAQGLDECGALTPASKVAGASGGAIAALTIAAKEVNVLEMHEANKLLAAVCRSTGTVWKIEAHVRAQFDLKFGDMDIAPLNERLTVVAQRVWPTWKIVRFDRFESIDALENLMIASCYIPFFLGSRGATRIGNELFVDGSLVQLVPELPNYVKICAFPATALRRPDYAISPSIVPEFPFSIFELAHAALAPPTDEMLDELYHFGKESAFRWAEKVDVASK